MISYMFTEHTESSAPQLKHLPVLQEVDKALRAVGRAGRYGALRAPMVREQSRVGEQARRRRDPRSPQSRR